MSGDEVARLERRMEQLLEVTGTLAAATSEDAVASAITNTGFAALGAAHGGVWLLERDKPMLRLVGASPLPRGSIARWTTVSLEIDAPLPEAVRTNTAIVIDSYADYLARYPQSFERIQDVVVFEDATYALFPIVDGGPPVGVLAITYDRANAVRAADRTFLQIIARQCALALERIRLHDAERTARFEAEEATRAREEILSVVSHDLRNPLGTILMGVSALQQTIDDGHPKAERIRTITERIVRQSERMGRLVEDLVDFAGIQAGRISIERRPTVPETIISQVADLLSSLAQERGVGFAVELPATLPVIDIDPERAVQVLSNLVSNAIKVTMKGGRVSIGATGDATGGATGGVEVVFFVRDSGPGLDATELPRLFERYWRSKKATYKGAGLGLSIARGIVDAHDGRIWVESQVGVGATFFFTLTPRV